MNLTVAFRYILFTVTSANQVVKVADLNVLVFSINSERLILREGHVREILEFEFRPEF